LKMLLGQSLTLKDLQCLDTTEFRSLTSLLDMNLDGMIFENFCWNFVAPPGTSSEEKEPAAASASSSASPFSQSNSTSANVPIPLKPGGQHLSVTNDNKREYVLLKAYKMLVGAVEQQMTAVMDGFHTLVPRMLLDKYDFTPMELKLLVCGDQQVDVQDLKKHCTYQDGYTGDEDVIHWFWETVEKFDDFHRRMLLQFWSAVDGMPIDGFGSLEPAFHIIAVSRYYNDGDSIARLPVAHTCFRQLDLPRYASREELAEKLKIAIMEGRCYMALS
jgi:hypothetical protein